MAKKKPTKNKTRAIAQRKATPKRQDLLWLGAQRLMAESKTSIDMQKKQLILMVARTLTISPFGVNILANIPYVNELGLKQKANQYDKNSKFVYKWIHRAKDDTEKAICECKLVNAKGKDLCDFILGECSQATMSMGTLKGYQNHMAQTRARNRAIRETYGVRMHEEMIENMQKLYSKGEPVIEGLGNAVTTSMEEMDPKTAPKAKLPEVITQQSVAANDKNEKVVELKKMLTGNTDQQKIADLKKRIGSVLKDFTITNKHASILIASLLNNRVTK